MGDTQSAQRESRRDGEAVEEEEEESGRVEDNPAVLNTDDKVFFISDLNGKADSTGAGACDHQDEETTEDINVLETTNLKDEVRSLEKADINERKSSEEDEEAEEKSLTIIEMDTKQNDINDNFRKFFSNIGLKLTVNRGSDEQREAGKGLSDEQDEDHNHSPEEINRSAEETEGDHASQSIDLFVQATCDNDSTTCPTMSDGTSEDILENAKKSETKEEAESDCVETAATSPETEGEKAQQEPSPEEDRNQTFSSSPEPEEIMSPVKKFFTTGIFSGLRKKKKSTEEEPIERELVETDKETEQREDETVVDRQIEDNVLHSDVAECKNENTGDSQAAIVNETEILSSQEKVQDSPFRRLFSGSSLKKHSKKPRSRRSSTDRISDSGEHSSDQMIPPKPALYQKEEGGPSQPSPEAAVEEESAWVSFKKLLTPKKSIKRSSLTNGETKVSGSDGERKRSEGEQISDESTEEGKSKRKDSSVSWEAVLCGSGKKNRSRKTSDSEDETPPSENENKKQETSLERSNEVTKTPSISSKQTESSDDEGGSTWKSFKKLVTPKKKVRNEEDKDNALSDNEIARDESSFSIKTFLSGRKKKKSVVSQDLVSSDEADKEVSEDEDSETPAVVPLSEFEIVEAEVHITTPDQEPSPLPQEPAAEPEQDLDHMTKLLPPADDLQVEDTENIVKNKGSTKAAPKEDPEEVTESISNHPLLSDIPEEGVITETVDIEEVVRDDTIADDLIEITSEAITAPEPVDETEMISAVSQLTNSSNTSGNITPVLLDSDIKDTEEVLHQVVETITTSPPREPLFSQDVSPEQISGSITLRALGKCLKEEKTVLEIHRISDVTTIITGLSAEEVDGDDEVAGTALTESISEVKEVLSTEMTSEVVTEDFVTADISAGEVHLATVSCPAGGNDIMDTTDVNEGEHTEMEEEVHVMVGVESYREEDNTHEDIEAELDKTEEEAEDAQESMSTVTDKEVQQYSMDKIQVKTETKSDAVISDEAIAEDVKTDALDGDDIDQKSKNKATLEDAAGEEDTDRVESLMESEPFPKNNVKVEQQEGPHQTGTVEVLLTSTSEPGGNNEQMNESQERLEDDPTDGTDTETSAMKTDGDQDVKTETKSDAVISDEVSEEEQTEQSGAGTSQPVDVPEETTAEETVTEQAETSSSNDEVEDVKEVVQENRLDMEEGSLSESTKIEKGSDEPREETQIIICEPEDSGQSEASGEKTDLDDGCVQTLTTEDTPQTRSLPPDEGDHEPEIETQQNLQDVEVVVEELEEEITEDMEMTDQPTGKEEESQRVHEEHDGTEESDEKKDNEELVATIVDERPREEVVGFTGSVEENETHNIDARNEEEEEASETATENLEEESSMLSKLKETEVPPVEEPDKDQRKETESVGEVVINAEPAETKPTGETEILEAELTDLVDMKVESSQTLEKCEIQEDIPAEETVSAKPTDEMKVLLENSSEELEENCPRTDAEKLEPPEEEAIAEDVKTDALDGDDIDQKSKNKATLEDAAGEEDTDRVKSLMESEPFPKNNVNVEVEQREDADRTGTAEVLLTSTSEPGGNNEQMNESQERLEDDPTDGTDTETSAMKTDGDQDVKTETKSDAVISDEVSEEEQTEQSGAGTSQPVDVPEETTAEETVTEQAESSKYKVEDVKEVVQENRLDMEEGSLSESTKIEKGSDEPREETQIIICEPEDSVQSEASGEKTDLDDGCVQTLTTEDTPQTGSLPPDEGDHEPEIETQQVVVEELEEEKITEDMDQNDIEESSQPEVHEQKVEPPSLQIKHAEIGEESSVCEDNIGAAAPHDLMELTETTLPAPEDSVIMNLPLVQPVDNHQIQVQVVEVDTKCAEESVDAVVKVCITETQTVVDVCQETQDEVEELSATVRTEEMIFEEESLIVHEIPEQKLQLKVQQLDMMIDQEKPEVLKETEPEMRQIAEEKSTELGDQSVMEDITDVEETGAEHQESKDLPELPDHPEKSEDKDPVPEDKEKSAEPSTDGKSRVDAVTEEIPLLSQINKDAPNIEQGQILTSNSGLIIPQNTGIISSLGNVESPSSLSLEFKLNINFAQTKEATSPLPLVERSEGLKKMDVSDVGVQAVEPKTAAETNQRTAEVVDSPVQVTQRAEDENLDPREPVVPPVVLLDVGMQTVEPEEQSQPCENEPKLSQVTETVPQVVQSTEIQTRPEICEDPKPETQGKEPVKDPDEENDQDVWMDAEEDINTQTGLILPVVEEPSLFHAAEEKQNQEQGGDGALGIEGEDFTAELEPVNVPTTNTDVIEYD